MQLTSTLAGLTIDIEPDVRAGLVVESSRSRRMRILAGDETVFWARIENGFYGVWTLRRAKSPTVLRAIRAYEARADRNMDGWMRWFAQELWGSDASPLSSGCWHFTELSPRKGASSKRLVLFPVNSDDGLPGVALGLRSTLERPRITYEDWGSSGSGGMLPFRDASPQDAGRVNFWMKHARDATLPPLLFWWVAGMDSHLLLDGHDRLAAALEVGVCHA